MPGGIKRLLLVCIIGAILLAALPAGASRGVAVKPLDPQGREAMGDSWLYVIGIDTYIHWPRLATAVNDAKAVRDVLLSRYHFDKERLIELYNENATRRNIIGEFRCLAGRLKTEDALVIFYAGHGHMDSITKEGSWIPVESGEKDASAWISNHDVKNYLKIDAIKAKHVLLISDSCFSGDFFRGHRGSLPEVTDEVVKRAYALTSRQAVTSGGMEPVTDSGFGGNSVFSYFLVKALRDNTRPHLIPSDFFPTIKAGVAENAEQFPQFGSLKDAGGSQGGEIVLFLKREGTSGDLAVERKKRDEEIARLTALEDKDRAARAKEAAERKKYELEVAKLDGQIEAMKKRLGTAAARTDDSLLTMLAMVREKENQEAKLLALKRQREEEAKKRQEEIERLKREQQEKRMAEVKADIAAYEEIVSSKYGRDMKSQAWQALAKQYGDLAGGISEGDTKCLIQAVRSGRPILSNSIGMNFVQIPAGSFMMGSPSNESGRYDNETRHHVTITKPFYMQTTEVTQGQWKAVMGSNPSNFNNCGDACPVEQVSWNDVQEFIVKLNRKEGTNRYRLPTEAEWEYAARGGGESKGYTYGGGSDVGSAAWYIDNAGGTTHPVGIKQPNELGIYDMSGNVWEWCQDWFGDYPSGSATDPTGPFGGSYRVNRGGSWLNNARYCRSANRSRDDPGRRHVSLGFRLAGRIE